MAAACSSRVRRPAPYRALAVCGGRPSCGRRCDEVSTGPDACWHVHTCYMTPQNQNSLKGTLFVGIAAFLMAVASLFWGLRVWGESGAWTLVGVLLVVLAVIMAVIGVLCVRASRRMS